MNPCQQRNAIRRALRIFSEKFELTFTEITDTAAKVDIDIMFSTGKSSLQLHYTKAKNHASGGEFRIYLT